MANFLDEVIGYFAPRWGYHREIARARIEQLRKYEAASTASRVSGWYAPSTNADAEIGPALPRLWARARDLTRNNFYALKARRTLASHIVGTGIIPKARGQGFRTDTLNELWVAWGDTRACDFGRRSTFYGLQLLAINTIIDSGSCLLRRIIARGDGKNPLPLQIQVLEPDYVDVGRTQELKDGGYIKQGIEFDPDGVRRAYWLFGEHPGETSRFKKSTWTSRRVPASEISHVFFPDRAGQNHGVPWFHAIMMLLKDFSDYEDAQLVRQKMAACFAAFIRDIEVPDSLSDTNKIPEKLAPGRFEMLPPGKDIVFSSPPAVEGYTDYTRAQKQGIAAGAGISYEALTCDLSQVNFSSARIGQGEMNKQIDLWRWNMFIPDFCEVVWEWFEEAAELAGFVSLEEERVGATWVPPRREFIDPLKEISAIKDQIRCGLKTISEALRELGYDPDVHFAEYAEDLRRLDELGITLDSDPRNGQKTQETMPLPEKEEKFGNKNT